MRAPNVLQPDKKENCTQTKNGAVTVWKNIAREQAYRLTGTASRADQGPPPGAADLRQVRGQPAEAQQVLQHGEL